MNFNDFNKFFKSCVKNPFDVYRSFFNRKPNSKKINWFDEEKESIETVAIITFVKSLNDPISDSQRKLRICCAMCDEARRLLRERDLKKRFIFVPVNNNEIDPNSAVPFFEIDCTLALESYCKNISKQKNFFNALISIFKFQSCNFIDFNISKSKFYRLRKILTDSINLDDFIFKIESFLITCFLIVF